MMKRYYLVFISLSLVVALNILLYNLNDWLNLNQIEMPIGEKILPKKFKGLIIDTPGCQIPYMDVFDEEILPFIEAQLQYVCGEGFPPLFRSNFRYIRLNKEALNLYGVLDLSKLKCCYRSFWREEPSGFSSDGTMNFSQKCIEFGEEALITDEFIEVTCEYNNMKLYEEMLSFVPPKVSRSKLKPKQPMNVLVFGLHGMSRLNLHRQMPETVKALKSLDSVEFFGYNKVGDNTFENLIPILSGLRHTELSCLPDQKSRFDDCNFLWNEYRNQGYVTAFGEDSAHLGLFQLNGQGFKKQPTDYAYSYFDSIMGSKYGDHFNPNTHLCAGNKLIYKELLDYVKKFVWAMNTDSLPYFVFFWETSISHDSFNLPNLGDRDHAQFFKYLQQSGLLKNTLLIFVSDHGIRHTKVRETVQGSLEERLPFLFVTLPNAFSTKFKRASDNLRKNAKKLTTPFDLHQTLLHFIRLLNNKSAADIKNPRGVSLFNIISSNRNCSSAGIPKKWCTCQKSVVVQLSTRNGLVELAANSGIDRINEILLNSPECAEVTLNTILYAHMTQRNENSKKTIEITLRIKTNPGNAVFEILQSFEPKGMIFNLIGPVSRLNFYKHQSSCVDEVYIKPLCYCILY